MSGVSNFGTGTGSGSGSEQEVDDESDREPIIGLEDVTVQFNMSRGTARVLDDINIEIYRDEIVGFVGESGSGKSMLASSMLNAVVDPGVLSGDITYYTEDGEAIDVLSLSDADLRRFRWEAVSMVFQGAMNSFNPTRKVKTAFVETLSAHDYDIDEGMERARRLISDLYMDPDRILDSYPHELSGGMKQRALIALSLILEPNVLVMDEPTAALDLLMQRSIISLIEDLQREYDLTIIFITHDLPLVADLADRISVMYAFEFIERGPTEEILGNAAHPYTRMLLKATPNLEAPLETMQSIEGSNPPPVNVPSGCSFHTRCPLADDRCEADDPPPYEVSSDHTARCHFWEQAPDEIPIVEDHGVDGSEPPQPAPQRARSEEPLLSLEDVEVHFEEEAGYLQRMFGKVDTIRAVDGVSLDIYERDVVVLVGESGCGKTTLGKAAIGLEEPTSGSVKYRGQDIWDVKASGGDGGLSWDDIRQSLQIIHQDPDSALNGYRRVKAILEDPLRRWYGDMDGNDRVERILTMLETVGMTPATDYIERYPHQLSGGEKQRVALIRAMLMGPDLILSDEPVSALDVSLRVEMMELMLDLQDMFDTSYLFVSHDLSNARYIAEKTNGRIGVLYLGELVEIGSPEQVIHNPQHPYTKALRWATPQLFEKEDRGEAPIREIDIPDPTDPPSGCRYHNRCPEAREVCTTTSPALFDASEAQGHEATCFRVVEDHEYWSSPSVVDDGTDETDSAGTK